jgi:uncharacterized protein YndB with AHSA1/START domain
MSSRFVYVTYIRATPKKVWDALIKPEFTKRYFFGVTMETDWKPGSPWKMVHGDGSVTDSGEVLEIEPPKRLVLKWRSEWGDMKKEGWTTCTFEISKAGGLTKLEVVHETNRNNSKTIEAISGGWPMILSNLKTMLETGKLLKFPAR